MYDIIIEIYYLKGVQTKLDLCDQTTECSVKDKLYKIELNEPLEKYTMYTNEVIALNRPEIIVQKPDSYDNNLENNNKINKLQQSTLDKMLRKHQDVFSETPSVSNVYEHKTIVKDESKFVRRTYQVPMHFQQRLEIKRSRDTADARKQYN